MTKMNSWSGNKTTEYSLSERILSEFASFCKNHKEVYVYGAGKIGTSIAHYLGQSELPFSGFITSMDIDKLKNNYERQLTGIIIGVSDTHIPEIMPLLWNTVDKNDIFILPSEYRERLGNQLSIDYIKDNFWINIFVTNRCNLSCKSCSTFAPITPMCKMETDYGINEFSKDIYRLKELGLPTLKCIKFTGGEPFLHPDLFDMFATARSLFPNTPFECYTNGLIISKIDEEKLAKIKELGVILTITEYPVEGLNLEGFYQRADRTGLDYNIIFAEEQKFFSKRPLDLEKKTPAYCFADCPRYDFCTSLFLYRGKLWKCIYAFNSLVFNEAFGTSLELLEGDSLNLSQSLTPNDLYKYAISRIPYCGYCKPITEVIPWAFSNGKIEEWT